MEKTLVKQKEQLTKDVKELIDTFINEVAIDIEDIDIDVELNFKEGRHSKYLLGTKVSLKISV